MTPYMGMLLYHKNMSCEIEMSKVKNTYHWSEIMSVFSCIDYEMFSLQICNACVCLSLKKKHGYNYIIFYGPEVEVESMYFIVLTSIGRVSASEECVWKGRESWIIFSMLHVFTLIASCCVCVYECSQRSLLNSPGA